MDSQQEDPRKKLRYWLGKTFKVTITDGRIIVGQFVCTDRDANIILENSWEGTRPLGLALVPGRHIVTLSVMNLDLI